MRILGIDLGTTSSALAVAGEGALPIPQVVGPGEIAARPTLPSFLLLPTEREVGFDRITLLEEPQAAFYAYLATRGDAWRKDLSAGDVVLVCDIGGGTTDFSLIEVADDAGTLSLERIAVGDHILLGGDNMDLALPAP